MPYPLGKLPAEHLARLLSDYVPSDERLIVGPGIGHDAAVISYGDVYVVAKSDPITFVTEEIGWYAVHVNANDVACTGATACWFLMTLLLPAAETDATLVDNIFGQITDACDSLGIALVGGHTEITHGLDHPVIVGCMLGEVTPDKLVRPDGVREGDAILLTKGIAVEGTAILAREVLAGEATDAWNEIDESLLKRAQDFLHDPGISVVRDAAVATAAGRVHAMHDPTEGGLATGLLEMAQASGCGLVIDEEMIPIYQETRVLCRELGLDPLGLIASGSLLLAVPPEDEISILSAMAVADIASVRIGHAVERERGVVLRNGRTEHPIRHFARDEIARLFE